MKPGLIIAFAILAGCSSSDRADEAAPVQQGEVFGGTCPNFPSSPREMSGEDAGRCAQSFLRTRYGETHPGLMIRKVHDDGDSWIVSLEPQAESFGGNAVVQVSKHAPVVSGFVLSQ